jgi:hypothetical protein
LPEALRKIRGLAAGQGPRSAHLLAWLGDGVVVGWGDNTFHQTQIPSDLGPVAALAAGEFHSLAMGVDGTLRAWGTMNGEPATVPASVPPVQAIASGAEGPERRMVFNAGAD